MASKGRSVLDTPACAGYDGSLSEPLCVFGPNDLHAKSKFPCAFKLFLPVQPYAKKYFCLRFRQITFLSAAVLSR